MKHKWFWVTICLFAAIAVFFAGSIIINFINNETLIRVITVIKWAVIIGLAIVAAIIAFIKGHQSGA